jgi:hypothetical protein
MFTDYTTLNKSIHATIHAAVGSSDAATLFAAVDLAQFTTNRVAYNATHNTAKHATDKSTF